MVFDLLSMTTTIGSSFKVGPNREAIFGKWILSGGDSSGFIE
jgi:hypothetical protein